MAQPEELLNAKQVARLLGVSDRTVIAYANAGRLAFCKFTDQTYRFEPQAVDKFIAETRRESVQQSTSRGTGKKFFDLPANRAPQLEESE